jgi:hypothetical protein
MLSPPSPPAPLPPKPITLPAPSARIQPATSLPAAASHCIKGWGLGTSATAFAIIITQNSRMRRSKSEHVALEATATAICSRVLDGGGACPAGRPAPAHTPVTVAPAAAPPAPVSAAAAAAIPSCLAAGEPAAAAEGAATRWDRAGGTAWSPPRAPASRAPSSCAPRRP